MIPVDSLSSGQLELFLFLSALVLNDGREGIVFIDEPELHLDPQWHSPLLRALMQLQPRAQFIVATHSPAIFEAAKSYERHFLVSRDDPRARIWGQAAART
jgi:predicted ATP-binding protein involved in virulence